MPSKLDRFEQPANSARRAFQQVMQTFHGLNACLGTIGATDYVHILGSKAPPQKKALDESVDTQIEAVVNRYGDRSQGIHGIHFIADVELAAKRCLPAHLFATFKRHYLRNVDPPEVHTVQMLEVEDILGAAFVQRGIYPLRTYFGKSQGAA
jgi:hypothetical protein